MREEPEALQRSHFEELKSNNPSQNKNKITRNMRDNGLSSQEDPKLLSNAQQRCLDQQIVSIQKTNLGGLELEQVIVILGSP
jgi:hypothetical protein